MCVAQNFDAVDVRHLDVGHDDVVQRALNLVLGGLAAGHGFDLVAIAAQGNVEQFADRALVVADEDVTHAFLLPSRRRTTRPAPGPALPRGGATAARNSFLFPLPSGPTPCRRGPVRSDRRWRAPTRCRPQSSTETARRSFPFAGD